MCVTLAGGKLGGSGVVGSISGPGTVAPGASAGILTVSGNVSFTNTNTLAMEIGGLTAGTEYDRLDVTGTISLDGVTLQGSLIGGFTPALGSSFTILQGSAINGQFAQGTSITIDGFAFAITYNPGSVVLTAVPATKTWTGAVNLNWKTAAN